LSENTKTQQAGVVVMLGLNLGRTLALLTAVSRDENIQNNGHTILFNNRRNISEI
jgi:hypothetical protein